MSFRDRARRLTYSPPMTAETRADAMLALDDLVDALTRLPPESEAAREVRAGLVALAADMEARARRRKGVV